MSWPLGWGVSSYVQLFQGTPLLMQLFLVYSCVALLYFALCFPISWYAKRLERRMAGQLGNS